MPIGISVEATSSVAISKRRRCRGGFCGSASFAPFPLFSTTAITPNERRLPSKATAVLRMRFSSAPFDGRQVLSAPPRGMRLTDHADDFAAALPDLRGSLWRRCSRACRRIGACCPPWRWARVIGHRFFWICAEAAMPALPRFSPRVPSACASSAVITRKRPDDLPTPLESFWCARGYRPLEGVVACFSAGRMSARPEKKPPSRCSSESAIWKTGPDPPAATLVIGGGAALPCCWTRDRRTDRAGESGLWPRSWMM